MRVFPFERSGDLMTVVGRAWGPNGDRDLILVVDTGAAATSIEPAILEYLGYSSRDVIMRTRVSTPAGLQHGSLLRVHRFYALGFDLPSFVVQSLALGDKYGVDGLLGMNFLASFNFTVRPIDKEIHLEPVEPSIPPR